MSICTYQKFHFSNNTCISVKEKSKLDNSVIKFHQIFEVRLKKIKLGPGWVAQLVGASSRTTKFVGLIPGQSAYLG